MTTYNTGNPLGSADPRDLYDNAGNLDELTNSKSKLSHPDRRGVSRKTWHAIEEQVDQLESEFNDDQDRRENEFVDAQADKQQRFNDFIAASGYEFVGDYAAGIEITEHNQVVRDGSGEFWRVSGTVDLPYTTDGNGLPEGGALVSVGDAALRQELIIGSPAFASQTGVQGLPEALDSRVPTVRTSSGGAVAASVTLQEGDIRKNHGVTYVPSGVDVIAIDGVWIC